MDGTQASEVVEAVEAVDENEAPAGAQAVAEVAEPGADGAGPAEALRELVLKAHQDVVPEMVAGETLEDLLASVPGARAAYQRISEALNLPEAIPAGGTARSTPQDVAAMPAMLKIREGLKAG